MRTGRPKIRKDNAERIRICRLLKRTRALQNFYAQVLGNLYLKAGYDPAVRIALPWCSFDEFAEAAGVDIKTFAALDLPFIELDRSQINHPRIRIGGIAPKKEKSLAL